MLAAIASLQGEATSEQAKRRGVREDESVCHRERMLPRMHIGLAAVDR